MGPKTEAIVTATVVWAMASTATLLTALGVQRVDQLAIGSFVAAPIVTALAWWMHVQDKRTEARRRALLARIDELAQDRPPGNA